MSDQAAALGSFFSDLDRYFERTLAEHGPTARGVDWKSAESQELRFEQLLGVCEGKGPFSVVDYGCGYGALAHHMRGQGYRFVYTGFDISERMRSHAADLNERPAEWRFTADRADLEDCDYAFASGLFNLRLDVDDATWTDYVIHSLDDIDRLGRRGFAFNMLTSDSDPERMRADLFYGDPCEFFDHCKRHYSGDVALLHDYGLYEFTILVRKEARRGRRTPHVTPEAGRWHHGQDLPRS